MKRSTRTFGDRVLRSGKRTRRQDEEKRVRVTSSDADVVSIKETKKKILDNCLEIKVEKDNQEVEFEYEVKKGILGINDKIQKVENFGDFKKMSEFVDNCDNVSKSKKFGYVYTRKRKRNTERKGQNVVKNYVTNDHDKELLVDLVPDGFVVKKTRTVMKKVPKSPMVVRVLLYNELEILANKKDKGTINGVVPAPNVREVEGYAEQDFVRFVLPKSYIVSRGDQYAVYDMDCDDEKWLEKFNSGRVGDHECLADETFEKVIDVFVEGNYCKSNECSDDAASAVEKCRELASKEVLETLYKYWRNKKKKKKPSPVIKVFQCTERPGAKQQNAAQKRLSRRRASKRCAEKEFDIKKAMLNNQKVWEEVADMYIEVHETRETAKRLEKTAIVKREQAQSLMEVADLATYRAFDAVRIAEALAASSSVTDTTGTTIGLLDE